MGAEIFGSVYERNSLVFSQGDSGAEMYIIQSGAVEISRKVGGKDEVLGILSKGDFFGEIALLHDEPRSATARTVRRTRLVPITKSSLLERSRKDPTVLLHIIKELILKARRADNVLQNIAKNIMNAPEGEFEDAKAIEKPSAPTPTLTNKPRAKNNHEMEAETWDNDILVTFKAGDIIFREGDEGDAMYFIEKGTVRILKGKGEDELELAELGSGDFFGEMAVISGAPRSAGAVSSSECQLVVVKSSGLLELISSRPEIGLHICRTIIRRLRQKQSAIENTDEQRATARHFWHPVLKKERIKISLVTLSSCAGCASVLLDYQILSEISKYARIVYCPILMDSETLQESDVAIVDGLVRLREDAEMLAEVRSKSRYLVAWGTCASFGGIPTEANRHDLDEIISETYGHTTDAFAYYLSGKVGADTAYRRHGRVALMRQAHRLDNIEKVDYFLPGCPPNTELLLQLVDELMGNGVSKVKAIVCSECRRKTTAEPVEAFQLHVPAGADPDKCLTSMGVGCMGFMTKGGCGAACSTNGVPCWGCRGPSSMVLKKILAGDRYEELFSKELSQRCRIDEAKTMEYVRSMRKRGHALNDFDHEIEGRTARYR